MLEQASKHALITSLGRVLPARGWKRWLLYGVLLALAGLTACMAVFLAAAIWLRSTGMGVLFFDPRHPRAVATRQRGDEIVLAIKRYHQRHGVYPETLTLLRPEFMSQICEPLYGTGEWSYRVDETPQGEKRFVLSFHAPDGYPKVYYESDHNEWSVDK